MPDANIIQIELSARYWSLCVYVLFFVIIMSKVKVKPRVIPGE